MFRYRQIMTACIAMAGLWAAQLQAGPAEGGVIYNDFCVVCHGQLGEGETMGKSLVDQQARDLSDDALIAVIRDGRAGTGMVAYGTSFNEEEILDLAGYVRVLQGGTGLDDDTLADIDQGDPVINEGRRVFTEVAGCISCHSYREQGGVVGPALDGVSDRLSAERLRQVLVFPDDYLTDGYEIKRLQLDDGRELVGRFRNETDTSIQILSEDGRLWTTYFKDDVVNMETVDGSLMPPVYRSLDSDQQQALMIFLRSL